MNRRKASIRVRLIALILVFFIPCNIVSATEKATPRASDYINSFNSYIYNAALGKVQVYFHVVGVNTMDDIGALSIKIYESTDNNNWTWVKTLTNGNTPSILGQNEIYFSSHIDYQGTIGRYYKAYVCLWAGKDGDGDTRYMWTNVVKASLFAG